MENPFEHIKVIQERRLAFLENTMNHYNSGNRCFVGDFCQYIPSGPHTEGCAIGRWLDRDSPILDLRLDLRDKAVSALGDYLPVWMKEMGLDFLRDVQKLHDGLLNWNENGLSPIGESGVDFIKSSYGLRW
jgi:hypothetical protein